MKDTNLTILLDYMSDGYVEWAQHKRQSRKRRYKVVVAAAIILAVGVNVTAFSIPMRYSTYCGSYGPDAVPVVDEIIQK